MIFKDFEYKRVDIETIKNELENLKNSVINSESAEDTINLYKKTDDLLQNLTTTTSLVYIRHSIDTTDEFYEKENDFYNENSPIISSYINDLTYAFNNSKFKKE